MKVSIFTTATDPVRRGDPFLEAMTCYEEMADEVVLNSQPWPKEFEWTHIADMFQKGYEACTGDWVLHMDLDFFFHEKDYQEIRNALATYSNFPAVSFWKWQFFVPGRYNLKSRLVIAVNKGRFGGRIKFDGGGVGDLCQPSLDGKYLDPGKVPEARIPFYNYDEMWKTKEQLLDDKGRFARAWQRTFNEWKLGGPDDESAYNKWYQMVQGRFDKHIHTLDISKHPKFIQEKLKSLTPDQFGHNGFGLC